jgi:hypothetical protein
MLRCSGVGVVPIGDFTDNTVTVVPIRDFGGYSYSLKFHLNPEYNYIPHLGWMTNPCLLVSLLWYTL